MVNEMTVLWAVAIVGMTAVVVGCGCAYVLERWRRARALDRLGRLDVPTVERLRRRDEEGD